MKYVNSVNSHKPSTNRDSMMLEYHSLVKIIAKKMLTRLPASIDYDDLISAGLIGLMQALERYKPEKGFKFKTFAEFRIRGAMLDELRSQDWCPKGMRQKAKQFERICEKIRSKKGRKATDKELCKALHLNKEKYQQLLRDVSTLEQMNLATYVRIGTEEDKTQSSIPIPIDTAPNSNPFELASRHNLRDHIENAMHEIPEAERKVLQLYYFDEMSLKEIGLKLALSESRVCQLHSKAIEHLKKTMEDEKTLLAA